MNLLEIIEKIQYGEVTVRYCVNHVSDGSPSEILEALDLDKVPDVARTLEFMTVISLDQTKERVAVLLHKGQAFNEVYMPMSKAKEYADYIFSEVIPSNSTFYNCFIYSATYCDGFIAVSDKTLFLFHVGEED